MTTRGNSSRAPTSSANVRRNLFHHHLGRRPTSASTSTSATTLQASSDESSADIVIRDKNRNYQVDIPLVPAGLGDDYGMDEDVKERERVEARLIELYKNRSRDSTEPAELLAGIQTSLESKVASLEEDNWIFEAEHDAPS